MTIERGIFSDTKKAPTKKQYVTKLSGRVTEAEINSLLKETPQVKKKRKRRKAKSKGFFDF